MSFLWAMAITLAAATDSVLISTEELCSASGYTIVDTRGVDSYVTSHIQGAIHMDPDTLSETRDNVVGLLKSQHAVETLLYRAGIHRGSPVVIYSGMTSASDLKRASRLFWILETVNFKDVHVLDGGFAKWSAKGHPLCEGHKSIQHTGEVPQSAYSATLNTSLAKKNGVVQIQSTGMGTIVDLRSASQYKGEDKKDFVARAGHIKDAVNIPAPDFLTGEYFQFKPSDRIAGMVVPTIKDKDAPVITYCNTGRDATVGYLGYRVAGHKNIAVYDGSMAEWGNGPALKMDGSELEKED